MQSFIDAVISIRLFISTHLSFNIHSFIKYSFTHSLNSFIHSLIHYHPFTVIHSFIGPSIHSFKSPPWPSGLKRWNQTLMPVVRARLEPRCGRPHFAPTRSGVRVCGRNRTEAREREWAEGTVSSLPGTLNVLIKFCHSTGIARSGGGVRASTTSYA